MDRSFHDLVATSVHDDLHLLRMNAPIITAEFSGDMDLWQLVATSHGTTEPCGPRLFRGGELPDVQFTHVDQAGAIRDCALLQRYCDLAWSGKAPKAKGREEKVEEPALTKFDFANAVWM